MGAVLGRQTSVNADGCSEPAPYSCIRLTHAPFAHPTDVKVLFRDEVNRYKVLPVKWGIVPPSEMASSSFRGGADPPANAQHAQLLEVSTHGGHRPHDFERAGTHKFGRNMLHRKRRLELQRSDRQRDANHPQDTGWVDVLESLSRDYKAHIEVRCCGMRELLPPSWMDLFLWSVLAGRSEEMVHTLWQRTRYPLRAAVLAAQVCSKLAHDMHDVQLEEELRLNSKRYEQWAIDLLDASDRPLGMGSLSLVPIARSGGLPAWWRSVLDVAASEQDDTEPCKRVVSHRHAQELLESFFAGDYQGSKVRISTNASIFTIALQLFLPMLPGTVCELMASHFAEGSEDDAPHRSQIWRMGTTRQLRPHRRRSSVGTEPLAQNVLPPEEFRLHEAADFLPVGEVRLNLWGGAMKDAGKTLVSDANGFLADMYSDIISGRAVAFYGIPKVRFVWVNILYLIYMTVPIFFLICEDVHALTSYDAWPRLQSGSLFGMPPSVGYIELFFWIWTLGRFIQELGSINVSSGVVVGVRNHLLDGWNKVDFLTYLLLVSTIVLRLLNGCAILVLTEQSTSAVEMAELAERPECISQQLYARNAYAVAMVLIWARLQQMARVFREVGEMSVVLGTMFEEDVSIFFLIVLIISPGFGIAFATLQPVNFPGVGHAFVSNVDSPFWTPFFALLGEVDRDNMLEELDGVFPSIWTMQLLLWIYLLVTTVVLVNLLIAQMSETYERSLAQGRQEWYFQRAGVIIEYKDTLRKSVPPPFNLIHLLLRMVFAIFVRLRSVLRNVVCGGDNRAMAAKAEPDRSDHNSYGLKYYPNMAMQDSLQRASFEALKKCVAAQEARREGQQMNLLRSLHTRLDGIEVRSQSRHERLSARLEALAVQQKSTS